MNTPTIELRVWNPPKHLKGCTTHIQAPLKKTSNLFNSICDALAITQSDYPKNNHRQYRQQLLDWMQELPQQPHPYFLAVLTGSHNYGQFTSEQHTPIRDSDGSRRDTITYDNADPSINTILDWNHPFFPLNFYQKTPLGDTLHAVVGQGIYAPYPPLIESAHPSPPAYHSGQYEFE